MKEMNTINGRTPDEIKKGLECCKTNTLTKYKVCSECAYFNYGFGCDNKLMDDALAYIQQLEAAAPKWISVEERLPHEDETVIVCADDGCVYAAQYWGRGMWRRELIGCARSDTDVTATHWMPLPEPPEEEE